MTGVAKVLYDIQHSMLEADLLTRVSKVEREIQSFEHWQRLSSLESNDPYLVLRLRNDIDKVDNEICGIRAECGRGSEEYLELLYEKLTLLRKLRVLYLRK